MSAQQPARPCPGACGSTWREVEDGDVPGTLDAAARVVHSLLKVPLPDHLADPSRRAPHGR